jgi:hypothetical protein
MTIQELINELQYAIDEIGYRPDTVIQADTLENIGSEMTYWGIELDTDMRSDFDKKNWSLAINVFNDKDS